MFTHIYNIASIAGLIWLTITTIVAIPCIAEMIIEIIKENKEDLKFNIILFSLSALIYLIYQAIMFVIDRLSRL